MTTRRWVALASVALLLLVMLVPTVTAYLDQRSRISALREQVAAQEREVADLQREKELWATDEYVEGQARQRLKFVKVGDKAYTVIDADPDATSVEETDVVPGESDGPWYTMLADSLSAADDRARTTP